MTDKELTEWCHSLIESDSIWPDKDTTKFYSTTFYDLLEPHHVDILLSGDDYDVRTAFCYIENMTPEQIDFGLNHDDLSVRHHALNHSRCTEAQKVWYHLTLRNTPSR